MGDEYPVYYRLATDTSHFDNDRSCPNIAKGI
jgi:hypothetical protein